MKKIKIINYTTGILLLINLFVYYSLSMAQGKDWNSKKCAVVLTYDDALNVHLDNVIPLLDSLGLKATFYLPGYFPGFKERMNDWAAAAQKGHELGNHTLFHPCEGQAPGREWVNPDYDLSKYTVQRMTDEINMANVVLESLDRIKKRTFAYPCGDMNAGDSSYVSKIKNEFVAARGVEGKMQKLPDVDLFNIGCYMINNQSGDELIEMVKTAVQNNSLLVFLFHGVGGEHSINVSLQAHSQLVHFLKENEKDIYIAPLVEVAEFITENRAK
jgi:peptidoglycan-N-acetylglucosamine deacetylase